MRLVPRRRSQRLGGIVAVQIQRLLDLIEKENGDKGPTHRRHPGCCRVALLPLYPPQLVAGLSQRRAADHVAGSVSRGAPALPHLGDMGFGHSRRLLRHLARLTHSLADLLDLGLHMCRPRVQSRLHGGIKLRPLPLLAPAHPALSDTGPTPRGSAELHMH